MKNIKEKFIQAQEAGQPEAAGDSWRLKYHLMPPSGWLNDPNGLHQHHGIYHIYYQYAPDNPMGGLKGWGHYSTPDFVHFTQEDIAVLPDIPEDKDGAYSGSAFVDGDTVHFFYTGNVKEPGDHDYINSGRGHNTIHFTSEDGCTFSPKEVLLRNADYPADMSCHVRDPKIFKRDGFYWMVLGGRTRDSRSTILIYRSPDLKDWTYYGRLNPDQPSGYMYECPDLIELDGRDVLITCPQGLETEGYKFENIYQNGFYVLDRKVEQLPVLHDFQELDHGFDFYAPQTFTDEKGRTILIGWMGMPDADYTNPTVAHHWQHALALPRQLQLKKDRLYQYPIEETADLRLNEQKIQLKADQVQDLKSQVFELQLNIENRPFSLDLRKDVRLTYDGSLFSLSLGQSGYGRTVRHLELNHLQTLSIFSDTSSLEIFINGGEYAFSTRVYDDYGDTAVRSNIDITGTLYLLKPIQISK